MELSRETLAAMYTAFDFRFNQSFNRYVPQWRTVATEVPSNTEMTKYVVESLLPEMREWIGERQMQSGTAWEFSIENKDYEATIELDRNRVKDNNFGFFNQRIDALATAAAAWPDKLVFDLFKRGHQVKCHDGQNYFDTDHPVRPGDPSSPVQSNLFENIDLTPAGHDEIMSRIGSWVNENGEPFQVNFDTVLVPTQLKGKADNTFGAAILPGGGTNTKAGAMKVVEVKRLNSDPRSYYYVDSMSPMKSVIFQLREAPTFTALDNPTDPNVFFRRKYIYGVDARGGVGFGLWFFAVKITVPE